MLSVGARRRICFESFKTATDIAVPAVAAVANHARAD
jgi:hypothetical protein